jgi:hypothetical protein
LISFFKSCVEEDVEEGDIRVEKGCRSLENGEEGVAVAVRDMVVDGG